MSETPDDAWDRQFEEDVKAGRLDALGVKWLRYHIGTLSAEITRLRAALTAERERCATVAEQSYAEATDTDWDIGFEQAKEKIAAEIRALPPADGEKM